MSMSLFFVTTVLCLSCDCSYSQCVAPIHACDSPRVYVPPSTAASQSSHVTASASYSQTASHHCKEVKTEGFSELTLFLLGSGLALFVALLGWSDAIRGINNDTRQLEEKFLATTHVDRPVFLSIVNPQSPDEKLAALTQILVSGNLKTVASVEVLKIFQNWHKHWKAMETLAAWKYGLSLSLTYVLFAAGLLSLFVDPRAEVSIFNLRARVLLLILVIPMCGLLTILAIITVTNLKESYFRALLKSLAEKV